MSKYSTIQQHEPLRVPKGWGEQERRLIAQLEEILDDIYRRFNRLRMEDLEKDFRQTLVQNGEDITRTTQKADAVEVAVGKIVDGTTPVAALENTAVSIDKNGVHVDTTGSFDVEAGAGYSVHSPNLDCDETGLFVKSGTLQGEHLTTDGERLLSASDIVVATTAPSGYNDRIWVKPLDSVSVTYTRSISSRVQLIGWSGTITTSGANSAAPGTHSYKLKIPYHVDTSSGLGADITVTVGGLTFTGHINPGHYSGPSTYVGDGTFEATVTSSTWIGSNNSLSISISGRAPGNTDKYKLNIGQITLQATSAGNSGAGWKACEIKVYQE
jgi:hypothetical protein